LLAGQTVSPESVAALEKLCRAYWQPIFLFARRKGWAEEDAKDVTQQFFARLLERKDFGGLDPSKGKFRTFLLTAFTHCLANEYDRASAIKRGGGRQIFSLEEFSPDELSDTAAASTAAPAALFDLRWAKTILETALRQLKQETAGAKKAAQFETLKAIMPPPPKSWAWRRHPCRCSFTGCASDTASSCARRWRKRSPARWNWRRRCGICLKSSTKEDDAPG